MDAMEADRRQSGDAMSPARQTALEANPVADHRFGSGATVRDRLHAAGSAFNFFQAVRLLATLYSSPDNAGLSGAADDPPVRFRSRMDCNFSGSEIGRIDPPSKDCPHPQVVVNFLGLAGAHGPLPVAYTPQLLRDQKSALRDFLDIFNHRLILIAYRIHAAHHPELTAASPWQGQAANELFALIGLGRNSDSAARNRFGAPGPASVPDRALLEFSGLLAHRPRSASGLERLLSEYFHVPATVREFTGGWLDLAEDQWSRLGAVDGRNQILGADTVLGKRVWDEHAGVTIRLGPLDFDTYAGFLPNGAAHRSLCDLARFYLDDEFDISLELVLREEQVPWAVAGHADPAPEVCTAELGRLAWLRSPTSGELTTANGHGARAAAATKQAGEQ
jgi:type VI secretion system protein ImpH